MTTRTEMKCVRCGEFSSARICWRCSNLPDAINYLELNAAQQRITQLEQALRELVDVERIRAHLNEVVTTHNIGLYVDQCEDAAARWTAAWQAARQALEHSASGSNERPAEESVPRGTHNLSPEEYDALVRDAMQWRHSKLSAKSRILP